MLALALLLLAQTPIERAISAAAPIGARVELRAFKPGKPCAATAAEVRGSIRGSGTVAVRLTGPGCESWGWAQLAVFVPALIVEQPAVEGARVAVTPAERELAAGRVYVSTVPANAVAARPLARGTVLEPQHLRAHGPAIGADVTVIARAGALQISQRGRVIGCTAGRGCAQLTNGRRVEGTFDGDRLLVELP